MDTGSSHTGFSRSPDSGRETILRLVAAHEPSIRRIIGQRSGPGVLRRTTLDDLFQETVTAALRGANSFVYIDDARFVAWMTTIARNVIARTGRDAARRPGERRLKSPESSGVGVVDDELVSPERTPSSVVSARECEVALGRALSRLPDHYREVITLYRIEGLSMADVAERMGRTESACCSLFLRAMKVLRTKYPIR